MDSPRRAKKHDVFSQASNILGKRPKSRFHVFGDEDERSDADETNFPARRLRRKVQKTGALFPQLHDLPSLSRNGDQEDVTRFEHRQHEQQVVAQSRGGRKAITGNQPQQLAAGATPLSRSQRRMLKSAPDSHLGTDPKEQQSISKPSRTLNLKTGWFNPGEQHLNYATQQQLVQQEHSIAAMRLREQQLLPRQQARQLMAQQAASQAGMHVDLPINMAQFSRLNPEQLQNLRDRLGPHPQAQAIMAQQPALQQQQQQQQHPQHQMRQAGPMSPVQAQAEIIYKRMLQSAAVKHGGMDKIPPELLKNMKPASVDQATIIMRMQRQQQQQARQPLAQASDIAIDTDHRSQHLSWDNETSIDKRDDGTRRPKIDLRDLSANFSAIGHYTISQDNTEGEEARKSLLLAKFGKRCTRNRDAQEFEKQKTLRKGRV